MKTCTVCLKEKNQEEFYDNITARDGYFNMCKTCCRQYAKYRRQQHPKKKEKQKIFYSSAKPLPPDPEHAIHIEHGLVRVHFV